ncbi:LysE/ArgO family amino acid transporter [Ureibacillus acetophenoni]|uniref:L-lysine exporter family protein LysE/ArgO n=1 Tax=Ureibacillus acetophenoni TaxID=614649 RepID=A0A285U6F5_9BACL|nr:LysE/ArgO family amino acid transporter [Ureibacillus acetophenoni]SOC37530.1 L-lysine exporter family protein LysE/ArgO [Ureibacillus acetophenoni]
MEPFFHGIVLAFGLILPLGVQNVFIFNQGATHQKLRYALPAVFTAGICDTILISLAVAGVSIFIFSFEWLKSFMFLIGFIFLAYMGWLMWKEKPDVTKNHNSNPFTAKRQILFAASVSLLNPHAILDTIGVIGTSSLVYSGYEKWIFTISCILISWIWFILLAITGKKVGQIDTKGTFLQRMNQISALIIWCMALYMGSQLFISN